jgi:hypothetical protein
MKKHKQHIQQSDMFWDKMVREAYNTHNSELLDRIQILYLELSFQRMHINYLMSNLDKL